MKKSLTILVLILAVFLHRTTYAQLDNVKLKMGPVMAKTKTIAFADLEPVGHDKTGSFYILTPYSEIMSNAILTTRDYQVAHVNNDMVMDKVVPLDLLEGEKEMTFRFAFERGEKIYVFSSFQNRKIKKTFLFVRTLNKRTLGMNDDLRHVAEIDYADENKYKYASFGYEMSRDKSKLLITYNLLDKKNNLLQSGFNVLDDQFNILYTQNSRLPGNKGIYIFEQFRVDNHGNVYLLTKYFADSKALKDNAKWKKNNLLSSKRTYITKANYSFRVVRFPKGKRDFREYILSIPGQFVTTVDMDIDGSNNIICAGFTSDQGTTSVNGTCFFNINDKSQEVTVVDHKTFGKEFITKGLSDKDARKVLKKINTGENFDNYRYVLRDIHFNDNGGYTLIGEKLMEQLVNVKEMNIVTTSHLYLMKEIVVVNFDSSGKISWFEKIVKNQEMADLGYFYTSFSVSEYKNNLYFLFTNLDKKNLNMLGKFKRTEAILVKMDGDGNQEQKTILKSDDDHITLRAKDTQVLTNGIFNLYGQQNENKYGFVRLSVQ